jgi:hypothetical protein
VQYDMLQCLHNTVKDMSLSYAFVYSANVSLARPKSILQISFPDSAYAEGARCDMENRLV